MRLLYLLCALLLNESFAIGRINIEDEVGSKILQELNLGDCVSIKCTANSLHKAAEDVEEVQFDKRTQSFRVNAKIDAAPRTISGLCKFTLSIPTLLSDVKAGQIIESNNITIKHFANIKLSDIVKHLMNVAHDSSDIENRQAKYHIDAGAPIPKSNLIAQTLIKEREIVDLVYNVGNMQIKTIGTALGNGGIGDKIKVKNNQTGAVLFGKVISKQTVCIE